MADGKIQMRRTREFQRASIQIFEILKVDLNGDDVARAQAARQVYEFIALLLAHAQREEDRAGMKAAGLLRAQGQVEFLEKRVVIARAPGVEDKAAETEDVLAVSDRLDRESDEEFENDVEKERRRVKKTARTLHHDEGAGP